MAIPPFTPEGLLPTFDIVTTTDELRASFLVTGVGIGSISWDRVWRARLVDNLQVLVGQLWQVGIDQIFVDGSFVEAKDHPNDIDGYFVCGERDLVTGYLERELNKLDPHKVWTWSPTSRRPARGSAKRQLPIRYRVELYPHFGQPAGILDEHGNEMQFPAAFRKTRANRRPKGILRIVR